MTMLFLFFILSILCDYYHGKIPKASTAGSTDYCYIVLDRWWYMLSISTFLDVKMLIDRYIDTLHLWDIALCFRLMKVSKPPFTAYWGRRRLYYTREILAMKLLKYLALVSLLIFSLPYCQRRQPSFAPQPFTTLHSRAMAHLRAMS